jgi:hypothetical protein
MTAMAVPKTFRPPRNDPAKLADEISEALSAYGRGADDRLLPIIDFFEGELRLIRDALRAYALSKKPKESAGSIFPKSR